MSGLITKGYELTEKIIPLSIEDLNENSLA